MAWEPTTYSLLAFVAAGSAVVVAVQAWRHRDQRGARPFTGLMLAISGWSLAYAMQLGFTATAAQLFWQRVGLASGGLIPTLWFLFTLQYTGREQWLTRRRQALLAVDPLAFGLLTLTNPVHGLVWDGVAFDPAPIPVVTPAFGVGYFVHIAYAYVLVAAGLGLLFAMFSQASRIYRRQTGLLILGTLPPFIGNVAFTSAVVLEALPTFDPTPFAFVVTGVLFGLALFRFDLLERTPIARERVLQEMGDGLVVFDADGHVEHVNDVAGAALDPTPSVGHPVDDLDLPVDLDGTPDADATVETALSAMDGRTLAVTVDGRDRTYDLEWSTLTDYRGTTVGHVLALRDVTDRTRYEQRLEVAQRVLRHNLRNDMSVVRGWARELDAATTDGESEAAQRILDTTADMLDLSEKMRTVVRMDDYAASEPTTVDVSDELTALVAGFREGYPDATFESAVPATAEVVVPDPELVTVAVRNLVENAVEHNDRETPWVGVDVETTPEWVQIRIADDGPPIPAMERRVLEEGTEDPLQHGSGVGLWLTNWCVAVAGGQVSFDTRRPRGNVVTVAFERPVQDTTSDRSGDHGGPS